MFTKYKLMKFKWLNKQGVESDTGFIVQFTDRFTAEYREGSKVIEVEVEDGLSNSKPCICFKESSFSHWSNSDEKIPAEKQKEILNNFISGIEYQGLTAIAD